MNGLKRPEKSRYLGGVRFFKHLILLCLVLMIAIPTTFCAVLAAQNGTLRAGVQALSRPEKEPEHALPDSEPSPRTEQLSPVTAPAAETPAWDKLYPDLYAPAADRSTVNTEKMVYLTFDDGPSIQTPKVLEILAQYNVKATFFVVGKTDEQSQQWMRDIVAGGHTLGMHTFTHNYETIYASAEAFLEDYNRIFNQIYEATGVYPTISRFPGGSINGYNGGDYRDIIAELVRRGFVYFDWNVATGDAAESGLVPVDKLVKNALDRVDSLRRAVVLMHDSRAKSTTVDALPAIIEGYRQAGFTFAALTPEVTPVIYGYLE